MTEFTREDFKKALVHHIKGNSRAPFYKETREALRVAAGIPASDDQQTRIIIIPGGHGGKTALHDLFTAIQEALEQEDGDRLEIDQPTLSDLDLPAFLYGRDPDAVTIDDPGIPFKKDPHNHRGKGKRK